MQEEKARRIGIQEGSDDLTPDQLRRIEEGVTRDQRTEAGSADLRTPQDIQDDRSAISEASIADSDKSGELARNAQNGNGTAATLEAPPALAEDTVMTHFAEKEITGADEAYAATRALEDFDRPEMEDMIGGN
jgi:hypothetical protein